MSSRDVRIVCPCPMCITVWRVRLARRFSQLNSNGQYRIAALVQVNNERLSIAGMRKIDEIESMFEFEDSKMYLSENTVIFKAIVAGRSNPEIIFRLLHWAILLCSYNN